MQLEFGEQRLAKLRASLANAPWAHKADSNNVSHRESIQQTPDRKVGSCLFAAA